MDRLGGRPNAETLVQLRGRINRAKWWLTVVVVIVLLTVARNSGRAELEGPDGGSGSRGVGGASPRSACVVIVPPPVVSTFLGEQARDHWPKLRWYIATGGRRWPLPLAKRRPRRSRQFLRLTVGHSSRLMRTLGGASVVCGRPLCLRVAISIAQPAFCSAGFPPRRGRGHP